jgi:hypothetical protein
MQNNQETIDSEIYTVQYLSLEEINPRKEFDTIGYFLLLHRHFYIIIQ